MSRQALICDGELACRTGDDGRRYLAGTVVPYGRRSDPVTIAGRRYHEMFAAGSARVDQRGIVLRSSHPQTARGPDRLDTIIGRAVEHRSDDDGLWAEFRMSRDPEAERLWGMADDGTLLGLSVEFPESSETGYAYRDLPPSGDSGLPLRIVTSALVRGCALVDHGAYATAGVTHTRASDERVSPDELARLGRLDPKTINDRLAIFERTAP